MVIIGEPDKIHSKKMMSPLTLGLVPVPGLKVVPGWTYVIALNGKLPIFGTKTSRKHGNQDLRY